MRDLIISVATFLCGTCSGIAFDHVISTRDYVWNPISISISAESITLTDKNDISVVWQTAASLKDGAQISFCIADGMVWPARVSDDGSVVCLMQDARR